MALDIKFGAKLFTHPNVNIKIKETDFYYTSIWKSYKIKNTFHYICDSMTSWVPQFLRYQSEILHKSVYFHESAYMTKPPISDHYSI